MNAHRTHTHDPQTMTRVRAQQDGDRARKTFGHRIRIYYEWRWMNALRYSIRQLGAIWQVSAALKFASASCEKCSVSVYTRERCRSKFTVVFCASQRYVFDSKETFRTHTHSHAANYAPIGSVGGRNSAHRHAEHQRRSARSILSSNFLIIVASSTHNWNWSSCFLGVADDGKCVSSSNALYCLMFRPSVGYMTATSRWSFVIFKLILSTICYNLKREREPTNNHKKKYCANWTWAIFWLLRKSGEAYTWGLCEDIMICNYTQRHTNEGDGCVWWARLAYFRQVSNGFPGNVSKFSAFMWPGIT